MCAVPQVVVSRPSTATRTYSKAYVATQSRSRSAVHLRPQPHSRPAAGTTNNLWWAVVDFLAELPQAGFPCSGEVSFVGGIKTMSPAPGRRPPICTSSAVEATVQQTNQPWVKLLSARLAVFFASSSANCPLLPTKHGHQIRRLPVRSFGFIAIAAITWASSPRGAGGGRRKRKSRRTSTIAGAPTSSA